MTLSGVLSGIFCRRPARPVDQVIEEIGEEFARLRHERDILRARCFKLRAEMEGLPLLGAGHPAFRDEAHEHLRLGVRMEGRP